MPCPPHSPWFELPNNIWWWVQIMKLHTVQLSAFSRYFGDLSVDEKITLKWIFKRSV
jgi:hypothetical protein